MRRQERGGQCTARIVGRAGRRDQRRARRRDRRVDDAHAVRDLRRVPVQEIEGVAVDGRHVGASLDDRVEHRPLAHERPDHRPVERSTLGREVAEEMIARRVVAGVRVLRGVRDRLAERVLESRVRAVGADDEVGDVDRAIPVAPRRGHRGGEQTWSIAAQGPRVAAHEHASHVGPLPQLVERGGIALVHHREVDAGARGHPREQPPPRRPQRGRPRVHAGGGDQRRNAFACASSGRAPSDAAATTSSLPYTTRALSRSPESSAARPSA